MCSSQSIAIDSACRSLRLRSACAGVSPLPTDRVEPVEADVPVVRLDRRGQLDPLVPVFLLLLRVVAHRHDDPGAVVEAFDGRRIVVALDEFRLQRHALLLEVEDHLVDERNHLAAIGEIALLPVAGLALARIRLAAEVRIALEHVPPVLDVFGLHERAGADRPEVEREVLFRHAGLRVELLGLPRNRREEGHRQPVLELRILALHADAQRVLVERLGPGEGILAEIEEGQVAVGRRQARAQRLVGGDDRVAVLLQPDDVVGHRRERRRLDARRGEAPDRVHVIVRGQLARAGFLEVRDLVLVGDVLALHVVIEIFAPRVPGERRMRREFDPRPELDDELRFRDLVARRVARQFLAVLVEIEGMRDLLGGASDELVGALQVVIAVQRLVHLVRERGLVVRVRAGRIEILRGSLQQRHEQGIRPLRAERMRIVRHFACSPSVQGRPPTPRGRPAQSASGGTREPHYQQSSWKILPSGRPKSATGRRACLPTTATTPSSAMRRP